jgi:hypothetical protein
LKLDNLPNDTLASIIEENLMKKGFRSVVSGTWVYDQLPSPQTNYITVEFYQDEARDMFWVGVGFGDDIAKYFCIDAPKFITALDNFNV